jgi:DNA primase
MAGIVPKRTLEEIRFRNDIIEVIGGVLTLKRAGGTFKALCPFHKEKTPSFTVNSQRQIFHCFGCGKGGDVFTFLQEHEGVDFMTAVRMLADRAGIRLEFEDGDPGERSEKDALFKIHTDIAEFYARCLAQMKAAQHARDYLHKRDLEGDIAKTFGVGYAPDRWDGAIQWARKHKLSFELMEKAGLIIRRDADDESAGYYDRFRDRLIFPICDIQGRVIGFSGRALSDDVRGAKYINSPETPLFRKSRVLYALDKGRRAMVDKREAIICEGQIDVIRCHQAGFTTAVASQGTAFTEDHANILRRYVDGVVIVFDPDTAGENAAIKTAGIFLSGGLGVRVAALPKGEDPDSFISKEGGEAFGEILEGATSVVDFQVGVLSRREDLSTDVGVMRAARDVLQTILRSPNSVQQARLMQAAAQHLNLPVAALQDELRHLMRRQRRPLHEAEPSADAPAETAEPPAFELALCEHLVHADEHPGVADLVERYLPVAMLQDARCRAVAEAALKAAREETPVEGLLRGTETQIEGLEAFAAGLMLTGTKVRSEEILPEMAVQDLILRLWQRRLLAERDSIQRELRQTSEGAQRMSQITLDMNSLKRWETGVDVIEIELAEE